MTPSSFPKEPVKVVHLDCEHVWEMYAIEWPPKVTVCTNCKVALKLVGHDQTTNRLAYRKL